MENTRPRKKPVFTVLSIILAVAGAVAPAIDPVVKVGAHVLRFFVSLFTFGALFPDATLDPAFELLSWPMYAGFGILAAALISAVIASFRREELKALRIVALCITVLFGFCWGASILHMAAH